jgi:hypothetical protein
MKLTSLALSKIFIVKILSLESEEAALDIANMLKE